MKTRVFAAVLMLSLLFSGAQAEFYTSNPDIYYHADADCVAGSTYEISEAAARQFEKLACPVCVNHVSRTGKIVEIPLPDSHGLYLEDADLRDGMLLVCGQEVADDPSYPVNTPVYPYLALFETDGSGISVLGNRVEGNYLLKNCLLSGGRIALVLKNRHRVMPCIALVDDMHIEQIAGYGMTFLLLESMGDGYIICCDPEGNDCWRAVRYDGNGRQIWMSADFPEKTHPKALFVDGDRCIILGTEDIHEEFSTVVIAELDAGGNIVSDSKTHSALWQKIIANLRRLEGNALVNGESVYFDDFRTVFLPLDDGWLSAIPAAGPYVRIIHFDNNGNIANEWFEDMGAIQYFHMLRLMRDGNAIYLFGYGQTDAPRTQNDSSGIVTYRKQQAILKKLEVKE